VGAPALAAPGVAWGDVVLPTRGGASAAEAESEGRRKTGTGFAPEGLLPESPPVTPGLEALEGALALPGALALLGALSFPGALAPLGALALPGALSPLGALALPGALAPLGAEVVCDQPRLCPKARTIDAQSGISQNREDCFITQLTRVLACANGNCPEKKYAG
jgi:hypothetical protein